MAVTTPIGISAGASAVRATRSARHRNAGAAERRQGQDAAVARPGQQPHGVGHDDPDEADQPADRDGGRGAERGGEDDPPADPDRVDAERGGLVVAEREHVEAPAGGDDGADRDDGDRGEQADLCHPATLKRPSSQA